MSRPQAILLIGPTGSGKTPLGDYLERHGLRGRPCAHFDFGRELREVARGKDSAVLGPRDLEVVRRVLRDGLLLEDEHFHIARKLLRHFLSDCGTRCADPEWIVLNGCPRHVGQATGVDALVAVVTVVHLVCPPDVVRERIRTNAGGDRVGRADDVDAITRRLSTFDERTRPLLDHYRRLGSRLITVDVGVGSSPEDLVERIASEQ